MKGFWLQLLWIFVLASCVSPYENHVAVESNFPLKQTKIYETDDVIQRIAVSDSWITVYTPGTITAIDIETRNVLWKSSMNILANDPLGILIVDDFLVATSADQVLLIDKLGHKKKLNLESASNNDSDIIRVASVYPDTIYLNRLDGWELEAYHLSQSIRLWSTFVGRGSTDVFEDSNGDTVYITTRYESFFAVDNVTGEILWQYGGATLRSTYEDGIIYAAKKGNKSNQIQVFAFDVENKTERWIREFEFRDDVYVMTLIDNLLIVSGDEGLLAINKSDGNFVWQTPAGESFMSKPIKYMDIIYAKGTSHTVYALSPDTGELVGYLSLETNRSVEPMYDLISGVYKVKDGLVFNTRHAIWMGTKE